MTEGQLFCFEHQGCQALWSGGVSGIVVLGAVRSIPVGKPRSDDSVGIAEILTGRNMRRSSV